MTFNDMLLSWLSFNLIMDTNKNEETGKKESLFFTGFCLATVSTILVCMVLLKLGITADQLQKSILFILSPFLWDYYLNFFVIDLTNTQHIIAAVGTIFASFVVLVVLEGATKVDRLLAASTMVSIQSLGFLLESILNALKWVVQAVLIVAIFKTMIHTGLAFVFWLI